MQLPLFSHAYDLYTMKLFLTFRGWTSKSPIVSSDQTKKLKQKRQKIKPLLDRTIYIRLSFHYRLEDYRAMHIAYIKPIL